MIVQDSMPNLFIFYYSIVLGGSKHCLQCLLSQNHCRWSIQPHEGKRYDPEHVNIVWPMMDQFPWKLVGLTWNFLFYISVALFMQVYESIIINIFLVAWLHIVRKQVCKNLAELWDFYSRNHNLVLIYFLLLLFFYASTVYLRCFFAIHDTFAWFFLTPSFTNLVRSTWMRQVSYHVYRKRAPTTISKTTPSIIHWNKATFSQPFTACIFDK